MKIIENETGAFCVDGNGVLLHYESTAQNKDCPDKGPRNIINLTIPEGVLELPDDAFRGYNIFNNVKLPASLKHIGENVFSGSHIDGVTLPENPDPSMMRQLAHRMRFVHTWNADFLVRDWSQEYKGIYMGKSEPKENWQFIYNDSGNFWIDSDGVLMDFAPASGSDRGMICRLSTS